MICYNTNKNQKTQSGKPDSMQVCIPNEVTARTTVYLFDWSNGTPDYQSLKRNEEFIVYVIEGEGDILSGDSRIELKNGMFVFIPSHLLWQIKSKKENPLRHLLLSIPLNQESLFPQNLKVVNDIMSGKVYDFGSNSTIMVLDRSETEQCEATVVSWPPHQRGAMVAHNDKEQTFYVLSGTGNVTVNNETIKVNQGDVVFVPFNTPHTTEASEETLKYLCFNTIVAEKKYATFDEMYHLVIGDRMRRWKEKDENVGL